MKTSFIATVLDEEDVIDEFIYSLLHQSKKPDEIIIVDGGSKDKTVEKLKQHKKVTLIVKNGNRSVGRNEGIKKASGDIILISDAGCSLEKDWVKNITTPFHDTEIAVVSGYYKPITHNVFEKSLSTYTCVMPDRVNPENYLPSSRSIAFRKSSWQNVGGYPENLNTCEDLVFAKKMKKDGMKFVFIKNAIVFWPQRKNISEAFKQFYEYAKGDGAAHYFRSQTPLLFLRYIVAFFLIFQALKTGLMGWWLILFMSFAAYIFWSISKNYKYVRDRMALIYLPLLQFTSDIAVLLGMSSGIIVSLFKK